MKTKIKLLTSAALFLIAVLPAQSIKDNDMTYVYVRPPLEPLKGFTNYQSKVELSYAAENAAMKADYDQKVADAEAQYQKDVATLGQRTKDAEAKYAADMKEWEAKDKIAEEKYQKELAEYNKKSMAEKLADQKLLNEGKPVKQSPPQPYKNLPGEPYKKMPPVPNYKKQYDTNLLASSYLKLEGFTNAPENAVVVTVTISQFDILGPKMVTENKQMTRVVNGQSSNYTQTYYHYETSYKQPMSVKVEVPGRGVIFNQTIEEFNTYKVIKTNESDNLQAQGMSNPAAYAANLEEKTLAENLKFINEIVNSKYGFSRVSRTTILNNVESKKMNYDDYQSAYDNAHAGYQMLATDNAGGTAKIKAAIETWEKAMTESNPNDKKARVDADVTMATRFNLAEAYLMINDFANAELQIQKINSSDPSKKEKKRAEELDLLEKDQKARAAANK
jgi:hypothetical protein